MYNYILCFLEFVLVAQECQCPFVCFDRSFSNHGQENGPSEASCCNASGSDDTKKIVKKMTLAWKLRDLQCLVEAQADDPKDSQDVLVQLLN